MSTDQGARLADEFLSQVLRLSRSPDPGVTIFGSWVDRGAEPSPAVCVVYKNAKHPHVADVLVGIRWPIDVSTGPEEEEELGPAEWAGSLFSSYIEEPLGTTVNRLRRDQHGIGWFGYISDPLPDVPDDLLRQLRA
ncbi:conserved hypothetical protein [Frankia sp. AiPs1]|uniref:hypothetical protein n=1 Tax=Frankia sp. AiPa1 TaxID=573492 RepID=UPI00202AFB51|nr:hypothetical protein [Frankia sp. AiPa1]MCL9760312.1 hypothetical protein [Frankia sp. AiPa1]